LTAVLDEVDVCKNLVELLSGVMSEFVRLDETLPVGIFSLMRAFKHEDSSDPTLVQTAKSCMTNLTSALNFLKTLADILFIFIRDRYQMIPIFSKLANTDLVKILVTVLENFTKLQCIERTLGGNKVITRYVELLHKIMTHQSGAGRETFLNE